MPFDPRTLTLLDQSEEVEIETPRPDGSVRGTIIWIMVEGAEVFVRSVRGERGYWFQAATQPGAQVAVVVDDQHIAVTVEAATDARSISACNRALERKYAGDPSLASMLVPAVLGTTLRLEPA